MERAVDWRCISGCVTVLITVLPELDMQFGWQEQISGKNTNKYLFSWRLFASLYVCVHMMNLNLFKGLTRSKDKCDFCIGSGFSWQWKWKDRMSLTCIVLNYRTWVLSSSGKKADSFWRWVVVFYRKPSQQNASYLIQNLWMVTHSHCHPKAL